MQAAYEPGRVFLVVSMLGDSTVCTYCKGQAVIAFSSGKAEYGLVSATSPMLGLQSILRDW